MSILDQFQLFCCGSRKPKENNYTEQEPEYNLLLCCGGRQDKNHNCSQKELQQNQMIFCDGKKHKENILIKQETQQDVISTDEFTINKKENKKYAKMKRNPWSKEEDAILLNYYQKYPQNWQQISKYMKDRSGKQIRDRYINALDPNINRNEWTHEEDKLILAKFMEVGSKWSVIAQSLVGRPENMTKNRYYSSIKKRLNKGEFQENQKKISQYKNLFYKIIIQRQTFDFENEFDTEQYCNDYNSQSYIDNFEFQKDSITHQFIKSNKNSDFSYNQHEYNTNNFQNQHDQILSYEQKDSSADLNNFKITIPVNNVNFQNQNDYQTHHQIQSQYDKANFYSLNNQQSSMELEQNNLIDDQMEIEDFNNNQIDPNYFFKQKQITKNQDGLFFNNYQQN